MSKTELKKTLCRLARFGANISDAYSCFIFLPDSIFSRSSSPDKEGPLSLWGYHSLSNDVITSTKFDSKSGLIGWVAEHKQVIHVSPFEHDSRTLGTYHTDQELKSFIGIPVVDLGKTGLTGVLACDSRKSFAFSKLQGKLLEDLAREISHATDMQLRQTSEKTDSSNWLLFKERAEALLLALGKNSLEALRIKIGNFSEIESNLNSVEACQITDQLLRLIEQALPPHFPIFRLTNGDIIIVLDSMMTSFYENKIRALSNHVCPASKKIDFIFTRKAFRDKKFRNASLEDVVKETSSTPEQPEISGTGTFGSYQNRRFL